MDFSLFSSNLFTEEKKKQENCTIISHILYFANCIVLWTYFLKIRITQRVAQIQILFYQKNITVLFTLPTPTPTHPHTHTHTHTHENTQGSYALFSEMSRWIRRTIHIKKKQGNCLNLSFYLLSE